MTSVNKKNRYAIKTSSGTSRKYPNVIWFPRSKTDPREIREVLKLAVLVQDGSSDDFFNDRLLGEHMAKIGSINVVGLDGGKYIESYRGKSIGDVSYITNARMLMRLFRFLGLVSRIEKGKYVVTDLGRVYADFSGDFPDYKNGVSEERMLLENLANFAFYSVNDDPTYRDTKFRIRPFIWLLEALFLEPQCIFQLIVTAFASNSESEEEVHRIKKILDDLRKEKTNLKKEWKKVGLDADDYSCVHNFYDSVKILVYLGSSLGLIRKTSDAAYGKKIAGGGRHLKQATVFYALTEKGAAYLQQSLEKRLIFYDELYDVFGNNDTLQAAVLLASLNYEIGTLKVDKIDTGFFDDSFELDRLTKRIKDRLGVEIIKENDSLSLRNPVSFSFSQSIPPEILLLEQVQQYYLKLKSELAAPKKIKVVKMEHSRVEGLAEYYPYFELDRRRRAHVISKNTEILEGATHYAEKKDILGGQDRFSSRVSPTNSIIVVGNSLHVDIGSDALDLLVPLRVKDKEFTQFVNKNSVDLLDYFVKKSDIWEKDQHYTWIRNCFRHLGMEAIYSGSGGMLSRADVSVISPFIGGIEAKSPRENRGTINTKAIRQAVDAKIQVADKFKSSLPKSAIAIGRRISVQAINEERKWSKEGQPVMLLTDTLLHYLILKSAEVSFSVHSLVDFFTKNHGLITTTTIASLISVNTRDKAIIRRSEAELKHAEAYIALPSDD